MSLQALPASIKTITTAAQFLCLDLFDFLGTRIDALGESAAGSTSSPGLHTEVGTPQLSIKEVQDFKSDLDLLSRASGYIFQRKSGSLTVFEGSADNGLPSAALEVFNRALTKMGQRLLDVRVTKLLDAEHLPLDAPHSTVLGMLTSRLRLGISQYPARPTRAFNAAELMCIQRYITVLDPEVLDSGTSDLKGSLSTCIVGDFRRTLGVDVTTAMFAGCPESDYSDITTCVAELQKRPSWLENKATVELRRECAAFNLMEGERGTNERLAKTGCIGPWIEGTEDLRDLLE